MRWAPKRSGRDGVQLQGWHTSVQKAWGAMLALPQSGNRLVVLGIYEK